MVDIEKSYLVKASLERVDGGWISEDCVVAPATRLRINAEVGGGYHLISDFGGQQSTMKAVFSEVVPAEKLVYSWQWNGDGHISQVIVRFSPQQQSCRIEVVHHGLSGQHNIDTHSKGWDSYVAGLSKYF